MWRLEWGDQEAWFLDLAREGDAPRALAERPALRRDLQFVWNAFWKLSGDRQLGFGGAGPLPFTAIDRYAARYRIDATDDFDRFAALIGAMDQAYLKWASERAETSKETR